jgi:4-carboxymuconolactone decarboxylase
MTLLDHNERTRKGVETQAAILGAPASEPETIFESTWRDYVFAEVWNRPALDRRSRYWIAIAGAAGVGCQPEVLDGYLRGALKEEIVTLEELREGVLHLAVYEGWVKGRFFDAAVTRVANELGLPPAPYVPVRSAPWDPEVRLAEGGANYSTIMVTPAPHPQSAYIVGGIRGFVFAEMWMRPGLDKRARRWITLVGVANSSSVIPIESHIWAGVASRDATPEEMEEFVLQYALHAGWPMASFVQQTVQKMNQRFLESQQPTAE